MIEIEVEGPAWCLSFRCGRQRWVEWRSVLECLEIVSCHEFWVSKLGGRVLIGRKEMLKVDHFNQGYRLYVCRQNQVN